MLQRKIIMISFKLFSEMIASIKEQNELDQKVSDVLGQLCDSYIMMNSRNKMYSALYKLLGETMDDVGDYIGWWLYEDVEKKITIKNTKSKKTKIIDVSDIKDFYNFLVKNAKERAKNVKT